MKISKFRVLSLIAVLGCIAAGPMVARSRTRNAQVNGPKVLARPGSYVAQASAVAHSDDGMQLLPSAGAADLESQRFAAPPTNSLDSRMPTSATSDWSSGSSTVQELFAPPISPPSELDGPRKPDGVGYPDSSPDSSYAPSGASPNQTAPAKKRQVVDLRDRIASNATEIRGTAVSTSQPGQALASVEGTGPTASQNSGQKSTPQWVDLTIPTELFERAQMSPPGSAGQTGVERAGSSSTRPKSTNSNANADSGKISSAPIEKPESTTVAPTRPVAPSTVRDLAPPPSAVPEVKPNQPTQPTQPTQPAQTSAETRREIPVRSGFTPEQAIPNWVYDKAGAKHPGDSSQPPTAGAKPLSTTPSTAQEPVYAVPKTDASPQASAKPEALRGSIVDRSFRPQPGASQLQPGASQLQPGASQIQPGASQLQPGASQIQPGQARPNPAATTLPNMSTVPSLAPPTLGQSGPATSGAPNGPSSAGSGNAKKNYDPVFCLPEQHPTEMDQGLCRVGYSCGDFSCQGGPQGNTFDACAAAHVYRSKFAVKTQRPLVELWRPLYTGGVYPPAKTWFGVTNPMKPHFLVYGDARTAIGFNQNAKGKSNVWGNVLNLDMDLQLTSTERIHAFVSPLNRATKASGLSFNDGVDLIDGTNFNFNTLFFEGDAGALIGGANGVYPPFDLPFTFGLIPLVYQNGIWANDAMLGAAMAIPSKHSSLLKWSNFDASIFWATDNITTDAFPGKDHAADLVGTAWFIDAYDGYIEADYAFVSDNTGNNLGYHNISLAFTRRYLAKLSNSVRFIVNAGQQDLAKSNRTADGNLLLIENSFITAYPNTIVPYFNLFYGQGRPQSLARAGVAGGILTNTGINFETDGITGYPTLDPTGRNTVGFASGVNLLGSQFKHQLVLEFAMLQALGSQQFRNAKGDEYGLGVRYQKPLSNNLIFRTDQMVGLRDNATNLTGSRFELRWKF